MAGLSHIVAAVAVVLVAMCHASEALKLQLDPGMKKCLGQDLTEDTLVVGNYHLFGVQSGPTATEIKITSPKGTVMYEKEDISAGKFAFTAKEAGMHQVCFSNYDQQLRVLVFSMKSGVEAKDYSEVAKKEHLEPLEVELRRLEDAVGEIYDEMKYMREREEAMRNTNESTNSRVLWYSVFTIVVLLTLGATQLFILRRDFKNKKII